MVLAELAAGFRPSAAGADPNTRCAERRPLPLFVFILHVVGRLSATTMSEKDRKALSYRGVAKLGCDSRIARTRWLARRGRGRCGFSCDENEATSQTALPLRDFARSGWRCGWRPLPGRLTESAQAFPFAPGRMAILPLHNGPRGGVAPRGYFVQCPRRFAPCRCDLKARRFLDPPALKPALQ